MSKKTLINPENIDPMLDEEMMVQAVEPEPPQPISEKSIDSLVINRIKTLSKFNEVKNQIQPGELTVLGEGNGIIPAGVDTIPKEGSVNYITSDAANNIVTKITNVDNKKLDSQTFENAKGTSIATLTKVGEKYQIPMSQIPATATQEIYEVSSDSELTSLIAQKGDLAELVEEIDGERTVTKTWQLLGEDSTIRDNWVVWGTSYAVQAGNATTANTAEDAVKVNGHNIVKLTKAEWDAIGTKDLNTYYLVVYDDLGVTL